MAAFTYFIVTLIGVLGAWLYQPARHFVTVLGIRPFESTANIHGTETHFIPDTVSCEDLEFHSPSGLLFTACIGDVETARGWNPGAEALARPDRPAFGTIVVINPTTLQSHKLTLQGFSGPFATHGIALYSPPSDPNTVFIYAINHLPNPRWTAEGSKTKTGEQEEKAASQIELFSYTIGSDAARHIRSITHPLIRTPNDLLAISETEFLVTNDHYYRSGPMRLAEEFLRHFGSWTDLIHVRFSGDNNDDKSIDAAVVLDTIPTNNGLNWGPEKQVIIGDAVGGHVYFASLPHAENRTMSVSHSIPIDCVVDNANFFSDPYARDGKDYSGYLLPGLSDALHFVSSFQDPELKAPIPGHVWYLPAIAGRDKSVDGAKMSKLIFKDDGHAIRSVTTAVMVPIDPATNDGKREGWLFVTSVIGAQMLATKIDFATALV